MTPEVSTCCCICLARGKLTPAVQGWDGAPTCRECVIECGGPDLQPPRRRFVVIEGGKASLH